MSSLNSAGVLPRQVLPKVANFSSSVGARVVKPPQKTFYGGYAGGTRVGTMTPVHTVTL